MGIFWHLQALSDKKHPSFGPPPLLFANCGEAAPPLPPFISLPIHHHLQNLTIPSQVPGKKLISKENEAENQREMSRSAPSAARRSQINAVNVCLFLWLTTKKSPFLPPPTGLMSSWLLAPVCWWSSFCFTSSSPVATHPKTSYSLVINTALSLSQRLSKRADLAA